MVTEHSSKHALSMAIWYLVGMDMERSLSLSEPPMPGPPGLLTRRARLMAIRYLVGMDMERSLSLSEPPMPGPPGLLTRRARLMAVWSITSNDFWRWFTGRSRSSLHQEAMNVCTTVRQHARFVMLSSM
jgi:hypothetical protein